MINYATLYQPQDGSYGEFMTENYPVQHYKKIINSINEAILVVGVDGIIIMANNAFVDLSGFLLEDLVGSECTILNCDACEPNQLEATGYWCKLFAVGLMEDKDCTFIRKDGDSVSVLKSTQILTDDQGKTIGTLETFKELTQHGHKDLLEHQLVNLLEGNTGFFGMIGNSPEMRHIYQVIIKAAQADSPVIIYGESGTGKELAAYAIHKLGPRKEGPFVRCNCAALNESLLESELFGHTKGAFTGAYQHRQGRFQAAHGGDIFLDEIGEIPMPAQTKLLHVLESKQFERVGDNHTIDVDVRIISATNRDLQQQIKIGKFREDVYFRINVVPIHLPPLRERKEDIPLLVHAFMHKLRAKTQKDIENIDDGVFDIFNNYNWPGNIRELKSAMEYAFVLSDSITIEPQHLPAPLSSGMFANKNPNPSPTLPEVKPDANANERTELIEALRMANGNKTTAAKILGVHRMTVWNRMRKHGIHLKKDIQQLPLK